MFYKMRIYVRRSFAFLMGAIAFSSPTWASLGGLPDISGDNQPDIALISPNSGDREVTLLSGTDGSWIGAIEFFNPNWMVSDHITMRDGNGDGVSDDPAIAALATSSITGQIMVQLRYAGDASVVRSNIGGFFSKDWDAKSIGLLLDSNGDGNTNDAAILVLATKKSTGRHMVEARRIADGARIGRFGAFFTPDWGVKAVGGYVTAADGPIIAVLGSDPVSGNTRIDTRDMATETRAGIFVSSSGLRAIDMAIVADHNGDGTANDPAAVVLGKRVNGGANVVRIRNLLDGSAIDQLQVVSGAWEGLDVAVLPDAGGTDVPGLVSYSEKPGKGVIRVRTYGSNSKLYTHTFNIPAPSAKAYVMTDMKHQKSLLANYDDVYSGKSTYTHGDNRGRKVGHWRWEYVETGNDGYEYFHLWSRYKRQAIVAASANGWALNRIQSKDDSNLWRKEEIAPNIFRIINRKYGTALLAGDNFDNQVYLQFHNDRENAKWRLDEVDFDTQDGEYSGVSFYLTNVGVGKDLNSNPTGDQFRYEAAAAQTNAQWRIDPQPATANCPGKFGDWNHLIDRKRGYGIVAGDVDTNRLYHQPLTGTRDNELWKFVPQPNGTLRIVDCKHNEEIVAGAGDNQIYHLASDAGESANHEWKVNRVLELDMLTKEQHAKQGYIKDELSLQYLLDAYSPQWRFHPQQRFFPVDVVNVLDSPDVGMWRQCDAGSGDPTRWYLNFSDDFGHQAAHQTYGGKANAFAEPIAGGYKLTYYLYYTYNVASPFTYSQDHEGDWERASVLLQWRLDGETPYLEPTLLITEAHGNVWWSRWGTANNSVWFASNGTFSPRYDERGEVIYPPRVYVAQDSNGTYPNTSHEHSYFDEAPGKDDVNRTCDDSTISIAHIFCDYIAGTGQIKRYTGSTLNAFEVVSDAYGLNKFVELGTEITPPWFNKDYACPYKPLQDSNLWGPIYRWGGPEGGTLSPTTGPEGPLGKKVWGWDNTRPSLESSGFTS